MDQALDISALGMAVSWVEQLLTGSAASILATIALAGAGLLMLTGRIELRRGASIVLGCYLIFGAISIANGVMTIVHQEGAAPPTKALDSPAPAYTSPAPGSTPQKSNFDPYAGAALPQK